MSTGGLSSSETTSRRPWSRPNYWPARLRILRRLAVLFLAGLLLAAFAVGASRKVRMLGLSNVGDPFGPPARPQPAATIGTDNDGNALYKQAFDHLKPVRTINDHGGPKPDLRVTWTQADPGLRQWVRDNAQPSEFFLQAAELPGAIGESGPADRRDPLYMTGTPNFYELVWLAILRGSRLAEAEDMADAWRWYHAALASTYASGHDNDVYGRLHAQEIRRSIAIPINAWAEDPAVTAAMLRQALDEVLLLQKRIPSDLSTLQAAYHRLTRDIDDGMWSTPRESAPWNLGFAGYELPLNLAETSWWCRRFLDNEPERSRRVIRLAFANWRARFTQPAQLRPKPSIKVIVQQVGNASSVEFFTAGPDAPESATERRMSPHRLAAWYVTTDDAKVPLADFWSTFQAARIREQSGHAALLIHLAEQLYLRERGELPQSTEALVGPYLKSLPDDGSSQLDEGTTPTLQIQ